MIFIDTSYKDRTLLHSINKVNHLQHLLIYMYLKDQLEAKRKTI